MFRDNLYEPQILTKMFEKGGKADKFSKYIISSIFALILSTCPY